MNKRTVKEILSGLALGVLIGGLILLVPFKTIALNVAIFALNAPVILLTLFAYSFIEFQGIYTVITVIYWGYLGVMFTILIDLRNYKILTVVSILLLLLHLIVFYFTTSALRGM